jgi:hypothetical protein
VESGINRGINPYLRDPTLILPFGALQSFQVVAGTVVVHQLPAALGDAILPNGRTHGLRKRHGHKVSMTVKCQNGTGGVAEVVQNLMCKHEALRSNPSPTKKKVQMLSLSREAEDFEWI